MFKICVTDKPSIKRSDENLDQNTRCYNLFGQSYVHRNSETHLSHDSVMSFLQCTQYTATQSLYAEIHNIINIDR